MDQQFTLTEGRQSGVARSWQDRNAHDDHGGGDHEPHCEGHRSDPSGDA